MSKNLFDGNGHVRKTEFRKLYSSINNHPIESIDLPTDTKKHLKSCRICQNREHEAFLEHALNETLSSFFGY